jgi:hypothetical protein
MTRHRWDYGGADPYLAKWRICLRCATTGRTFGVGAGRVWSCVTADGRRTLGKIPPCEPVAGLPAGWRIEVQHNTSEPARWSYDIITDGSTPGYVSPYCYRSEEAARQAGVIDAAASAAAERQLGEG